VAIENLSVDRKDWVAQQAGYQAMLTVALLTALARKQLGNDQLAQVRDLAAQAALHVFGRLGERPFDIPVGLPMDERLATIFMAFLADDDR